MSMNWDKLKNTVLALEKAVVERDSQKVQQFVNDLAVHSGQLKNLLENKPTAEEKAIVKEIIEVLNRNDALIRQQLDVIGQWMKAIQETNTETNWFA